MINFEAPLNVTSIGQTSFNIYRELIKDTEVCLFPYGDNADLSAFSVSEEEKELIKKSSFYSEKSFSRNSPSVTIWHIKGSERAIGRDPNLFTFHETDFLTDYEICRLSQMRKVFVSSKYTKEIFDFYLDGATEVVYCPLGFDSKSFFKIKKDEEEEVLTFGLRGKLELRKNTLKTIVAWAKTFGGDPRYRLDCSIHNMFLDDNQMFEVQMSMPDKTIPWNINFLPYLPSNNLYNKALNQADIDLTGMSGCEGFNLPLFQSLCLGKQAIVLNAHVHKDYCNKENSILIEPNDLVPAVDNKFFIQGQIVNQGNWFSFDENDLIDAMISVAEKGRIQNVEGEKLTDWTFSKTAKIIKENII